MQSRLILVGPGDDLTMPHDPSHYENGRRIEFPRAGESLLYRNRDTTPVRGKITTKEYGLLILDDWYYQIQGEAPDFGEIPMLDKIAPGEEFAQGLQGQFARQGVLRIAGDEPTEEELTRARSNRQRWAAQRIEEDRVSVELGRAGHKGHKPFPSRVAETLRREYNVPSLMLSTSAPPKPPAGLTVVEDTPCPMCALPIAATAQKCRHCQSMFGMTVMDYITRPAAVTSGKAGNKAEKEVRS